MRKCGECGSEEELLCLVFQPFCSTSSKKVAIPPSPLSSWFCISTISNTLQSNFSLLFSEVPSLLHIHIYNASSELIPPPSFFILLPRKLWPLPIPHSLKSHLTTPCYLNILPSTPPHQSVSRLLDARIEFPVILFKCHFNIHVCLKHEHEYDKEHRQNIYFFYFNEVCITKQKNII